MAALAVARLLYTVGLYLNNALMQSPATISKTQKAIDYIKHFGGISRVNAGPQENGTHHITLILTNNNLSETCQWNTRLDNKLSHLNTIILSSNKDSDIKNIGGLVHKLMTLTKPDQLPDMIIMCTHEKRVDDIIELIRIFKSGRLDLTDIGVHKITLSIMMDEADKNMKLIVNFLEKTWGLMTDAPNTKDDVIRDIHFITATPLKEFWKALKGVGISKLKNVNHAIQNMDEDHVLHTNYADLMKNYRWLHDHERIHTITSMTPHTVEYANLVLASWERNKQACPRIVFAPAENEKASHYAMQYAFRNYGYWVYVDNSDKDRGKGFYQPNGSFQSVEKFRKEHHVTGEPYEVFKKWKELHPTESLAITGWLTIIRGITFNTTGFNFTDMILSAGHMHNVADLLQVSGRGNGDVQYVGTFAIHCPVELWTLLDSRIKQMAELHEKNVEEFEAKHFHQKTKREEQREEQEVAWTVPRVFPIGEERYKLIKKVGKSNKWDTETIFAQMEDPELVTLLHTRKEAGGQFQITQPDPVESENTYKKYITDFIQKKQEDRKFNMGLHKDDKNKDGYQIFLDKKGFNVIVSVYNGALIVKE
jgi:hypothetical protein